LLAIELKEIGKHIPQGLTSMVTRDLAAGLTLPAFLALYSSRRLLRSATTAGSSSSESEPKRSSSSSSSGLSLGLEASSVVSGP
jgi:hypothetical protein